MDYLRKKFTHNFVSPSRMRYNLKQEGKVNTPNEMAYMLNQQGKVNTPNEMIYQMKYADKPAATGVNLNPQNMTNDITTPGRMTTPRPVTSNIQSPLDSYMIQPQQSNQLSLGQGIDETGRMRQPMMWGGRNIAQNYPNFVRSLLRRMYGGF